MHLIGADHGLLDGSYPCLSKPLDNSPRCLCTLITLVGVEAQRNSVTQPPSQFRYQTDITFPINTALDLQRSDAVGDSTFGLRYGLPLWHKSNHVGDRHPVARSTP